MKLKKKFDDDEEAPKTTYVPLAEIGKLLNANEFKIFIMLHLFEQEDLEKGRLHIANILKMPKSTLDMYLRTLTHKGFIHIIKPTTFGKPSKFFLIKVLKIERGTRIVKLR